MKIINLICVLIMGTIIISCQKSENTVTNSKDYVAYLQKKENQVQKDALVQLKFWNTKIKKDSMQISAMGKAAQVYSNLFQTTGNIKYLKQAEQILTKSVEIAAIKKEGYLLALARNYISQHRFREAKTAAEGAYMLNPNKASKMVLFDIYMELGEYDKSKKHLEGIVDQSDYNFLIRLTKWNDYQGNLDATIRNMEKAKTIAESSKKEGLMLWSYTNLADYYGHAGRIRDSYEHYLKALQIDPSNSYAKKGIAWIVYSYEYNPEEALKIIEAIAETHQSPDYFLLKAEIAEYQGNKEDKEQNLKAYFEAINDQRYGDMYNTYTALLLAEEYQEYDIALQIAEKEISNRPTPQSYILKANILNLIGNHEQALKIAKEYVVDKTFEPEANYQVAQIYKANKLLDEINPIKKELIESNYELGPVLSQKILEL
ncbi:tetratricopeptide repeat protein [Aquimarina algiphila]|uniref:Cell surface protein n=1 Tax=Aquimarina algiphila TaxID=2047982 RepID=A0A554VPS0_9FLAO|nr:hypothetical protein [Aquimarina algiphila]TSE10484.1 hypothetical protein FOF46_04085 [Aquimarina algiphila]